MVPACGYKSCLSISRDGQKTAPATDAWLGRARGKRGPRFMLEGKTWPWVSASCQHNIFSITLRIHKHYISTRGPWTKSGLALTLQIIPEHSTFYFLENAEKQNFNTSARLGILSFWTATGQFFWGQKGHMPGCWEFFETFLKHLLDAVCWAVVGYMWGLMFASHQQKKDICVRKNIYTIVYVVNRTWNLSTVWEWSQWRNNQ